MYTRLCTGKRRSFVGRACVLLVTWWLLVPVLGVTSARPAQAQGPQAYDVTLGGLGYEEKTLSGPVSSARYYFGLPADWMPSAGSYLELDLEYAVFGQENQVPGLLTVQMNREVLHTESLEASSWLNLRVEIPSEILRLAEETLVNELQLTLIVDAPCEQAVNGSLAVRPSSYFHFVYAERPLLMDLAHYPMPIYQRLAFEPVRTRFVLPAEPSRADLQTAVMIAAQLGSLSGGQLPLAATLSSDLPPAADEEHLIIVGRPESNPLLRQLELPLPLTERQLDVRSEMPAVVVPDQAFDCVLTVRNTSLTSRDLVLQDHWPASTTLLGCQGECKATALDTFRWDIGPLAAGQEISTTVRVRVEPLTPLGESVEHTATLQEKDGETINIDTLVATVGEVDEGETITSGAEKGAFFFSLNGSGVAERDGLIQEIISPKSPRRAAIVVTGLSDEAVLKAGRALGAEARFPGMSGSYAIVEATRPVSGTVLQQAEAVTFASLGYDDSVLNAYSGDLGYTFYVPREWAVGEDASLFLHFVHSSALKAASATLTIQLNRLPIYNVPLYELESDDSWLTIPIPRNQLTVGPNRLDLQLSDTLDECMDIEFASRFWVTVYSDSLLHLPHERTQSKFDLADFPWPFSNQSDLGDLVFLLPERPGVGEVEGLLRLALRLGSATQSDAVMPRIALGTESIKANWSDYNAIALGRPTDNPYIAAFNDVLPQPFIPGTDQIRQQVDSVVYRLPVGYSLGYVQELVSPWAKDRVILVITGSTDEGVAQALDVLTDDALSNQLSGDLAMVDQERRVQSTDTRELAGEEAVAFSAIPTPTLSHDPTATPTPTPTVPTPVPPMATLLPTLTPTAPTPVLPTATTVLPVSTDTQAIVKQDRLIWLSLLVVSVLTVVISVSIAIRRSRSP